MRVAGLLTTTILLSAIAATAPDVALRVSPLPRPQAAKAIGGRFAAQDGGKMVLDRLTGLRWQQGYVDNKTWESAKIYCATNEPGLSGNGWRLPNMRELDSLVDFQASNPAIDAMFEGTPAEYFWSATPLVAGSSAWRVYFSFGHSSYVYLSASYRVRCVR